MNDSTAPPDSKVDFFARLMMALEGAGDRQAVLQSFCVERPELADEIRALAGLNEALDGGGDDEATPMPERLGEFRILRRIGRGGMGEIYEGEQQSLDGRRVAIKVIRHGRVSPEARARFLREQCVLARLHQTHIVPIHTAGEEGELQYFVMPYIEGAALHHVVRAAYDGALRGLAKTPTVRELASQLSAESKLKTAGAGKPSATGSAQDAAPAEQTAAPEAQGSSFSAASSPETRSEGAGPARGERVTLSLQYFRSVAEVIADAAEAVQYAHDAGFVHRDLKPSNIMVDAAGQPRIIDFGLAGYVTRPERPATADPLTAEPEPITSTGLMGTPHYMAPEQIEGEANRLSDVWGLGATLYELCTLRRPFEANSQKELHLQIVTASPPSPHTLVGNLPRDLAAISLKALQKEPAKRYPSAQALAADLRRWLRLEPTVARPAHTLRRMSLWSRRNPGGALSLILLTLIFGLLLWAVIHEDRAKRAHELRLAIERARRADELRLAKEQQVARQEIQQLLQMRLTYGVGDSFRESWSGTVWERVRKAAELGIDLDLKNKAAASLAGLDARREKKFSFSGSSVAFDCNGEKLLIGGTVKLDEEIAQPARLWDSTVNQPQASMVMGQGPVAFAQDGTPLQLTIKDGSLVLWDLAKQRLVNELTLPALAEKEVPRLALASEGSLVAASARLANGKTVINIWQSETGKLLHEFDGLASALAFSPDDQLLAAGNEDGAISIWSVSEGRLLRHVTWERAEILALAFARDVRRQAGQRKEGGGWVLAAGDTSGTVSVRDVANLAIRSICRGSHHHVHAVAFSPDGMTLASVGRHHVKLWDVATGRSLVDLVESNWLTGVTFSPDGTRVAVSSKSIFQTKGQVSIWALETGRGIQTVRGLVAQVEQVIFSPDDRLVAAVSHGGRVGVWDRRSEKLLHVFEGPRTKWVDNAGLAFSPDNRQLVCSGSWGNRGQAVLWDIGSGEELGSWKVERGLHNILAFHPVGKLLFFQAELCGGHPRAVRVYELARGQGAKALWRNDDFDRYINFPRTPADGRFVVLIGYLRHGEGDKRIITAFDMLTGEKLYVGEPEIEPRERGDRGLQLDRSGRFLTVERLRQTEDSRDRFSVLEMPSGKYVGPGNRNDTAGHSLSMPFWIDRSHPDYYGALALVRQGKQEPTVVLGVDPKPTGTIRSFNSDGSLLAWGNADGSVNVADLIEINRRLSEVDLGW